MFIVFLFTSALKLSHSLLLKIKFQYIMHMIVVCAVIKSYNKKIPIDRQHYTVSYYRFFLSIAFSFCRPNVNVENKREILGISESYM